MTITFENTEQDAIAYNLFYNFHTPRLRRKHWIIRLVSPVAISLILLAYFSATRPDDLSLPFVWLMMIGGAVADFAIHPWLMRRAVRRRTQQAIKQGKYLTLLGSHTLSILLANSDQAPATAGAATCMTCQKTDRRVLARGMPASHSPTRRKFKATAVNRCPKCTFAKPM
jgi:hypothetical protein